MILPKFCRYYTSGERRYTYTRNYWLWPSKSGSWFVTTKQIKDRDTIYTTCKNRDTLTSYSSRQYRYFLIYNLHEKMSIHSTRTCHRISISGNWPRYSNEEKMDIINACYRA